MAIPPVLPWLMLVHQLPPSPPYLRVKVWRRLQALGAVPIKNSVYVLPNTGDAREDFEWVLRELRDQGGEASICEARLVDGLTDVELQRAFQTARERDYRQLATSGRAYARETVPRRGRAVAPAVRTHAQATLARFRKRLDDIAKVDFFAAPGREAVEGLLNDPEGRLAPVERGSSHRRERRRVEDAQRRVWVTRTGIHIDRMASAWLIRRFIDPHARFKFVATRTYHPEPGELRFDMFDAEFTHQGTLCTFEVLLREFGFDDPFLAKLGEIVHDIDMKESTFAHPETAGVDHLVAGIAWMQSEDNGRLAQSASLFEALYSYFARRKR